MCPKSVYSSENLKIAQAKLRQKSLLNGDCIRKSNECPICFKVHKTSNDISDFCWKNGQNSKEIFIQKEFEKYLFKNFKIKLS